MGICKNKPLSVFLCLFFFYAVSNATSDSIVTNKDIQTSTFSPSIHYRNYKKSFDADMVPRQQITVAGTDAIPKWDKEPVIIDSYEGRSDLLHLSSPDEPVFWNIYVEEEGYYTLKIDYSVPDDVIREPVVRLEVDGKVPFFEFLNVKLNGVWAFSEERKTDQKGNDIRPLSIRTGDWTSFDVQDLYRSSGELYKIYFEEGEHTLGMALVEGRLIVDSLYLYNESELPLYDTTIDDTVTTGGNEGHLIRIQAEDSLLKSNAEISQLYNNNSPTIEPSDPRRFKINVFGGWTWDVPGQWALWKFTVPESGYYNIALKYLYNRLDGIFSHRKLMIDGKVPFREAADYQFLFDFDWQMKILGDEEPHLFYLEKGEHTLTLEVVSGLMSEPLVLVNDTISELNELYLKIIMITGTRPDPYIDYFLDRQILDLIPVLQKSSDTIDEVRSHIAERGAVDGNELAILEESVDFFESIIVKPDDLKGRLTQFKDMISTLAAWYDNNSQQFLLLDYIAIYSPDMAENLPPLNAGFWKNSVFAFRKFMATFSNRYTTFSDDSKENKEKLRVWITGNRDFGLLLQSLADETFTPRTGIEVQTELVTAGLNFLQAYMAGVNPDVMTRGSISEPVNYAIRGALVDLSRLPGYDDFASNFFPSAIEPYRFKDGIYGLPMVQKFNMLFYRKDILEDLGLEVPQTWDDFLKAVPIIQRNNMEVGLPPLIDPVKTATEINPQSQHLFATLLFQNGGDFFQDDLKNTAFQEAAAIEAFRDVTSFYQKYDFPLQYNFYSRFRTGEMPLAIALSENYGLLQAGTPELEGLWGMSPIPGTVNEDGSIDRSEPSMGESVFIPNKNADLESSWEFVQWWLSAETMRTFSLSLEYMIGRAGRFFPANKHVMQDLPWDKEVYDSLMYQWEQVRGIPEVPGGYYVAYGLFNAFRSVVIENRNIYRSLLKWDFYINEELERKRIEFGLE